MCLLCRLFSDAPATSARFTRLDPRNRSHAPPCQRPVVRVTGTSSLTVALWSRFPRPGAGEVTPDSPERELLDLHQRGLEADAGLLGPVDGRNSRDDGKG